MDSLCISQTLVQEMVDHVQVNLPEEACGLLAGTTGIVKKVIPVTNQAHSPVRYYMDPVELLHGLQLIERLDFALLGIFHSHPQGPSVPSETDIKEFLYPGAATVILAVSPDGWKINAFDIKSERYEKIKLVINRNDD